MKINNKLLILTVVLLAMISLGAVSAEDAVAADDVVAADVAVDEAPATEGEAAGGEGGGMGESLDNVTNDLEKFSNIFERIDFDVTQNKEGKFEVIDLFESDPPQTFENMTEVLEYLKPYIMDELSLDEEEVDQYLKTL